MIEPIIQFLKCRTPDAWIKTAAKQLDTLLIDHAHCEKKAASNAINFMFRYPQYAQLLHAMSRLAREELRHFEQVMQIIQRRGITFIQIRPSGYAKALHQQCRTHEPARLIDELIVGAIIEARSCERFYSVVDYLPEDIADFYRRLVKAEARHFELYLELAQSIAKADITARVDHFMAYENAYIMQPEVDFRFHSGMPVLAMDKNDESARVT